MAVPWIQVYSDLDRHPKIGRLAYELGLKSSNVDAEATAVGIVICLWSWVAQSVSDGDLSKCMSRTIANACRWRGDSDKLVNALKQAGFLDEDMRVHDWEEYAELFINREEYRKEQTRKRVQGYRDRKRAELGIKTCSYCGKDATGWDHIIPKAKGGSDDESNLVPCCKRCNSSKGIRELADFLNSTTIKLDLDSILSNEKLMNHVRYDEFGHFVTLQEV